MESRCAIQLHPTICFIQIDSPIGFSTKLLQSCSSPEVQPGQRRSVARQQPRHCHHRLLLPQPLPAQLHIRLAAGEEPADAFQPVEGRDARDSLQAVHHLVPGRSVEPVLPDAREERYYLNVNKSIKLVGDCMSSSMIEICGPYLRLRFDRRLKQRKRSAATLTEVCTAADSSQQSSAVDHPWFKFRRSFLVPIVTILTSWLAVSSAITFSILAESKPSGVHSPKSTERLLSATWFHGNPRIPVSNSLITPSLA